MNIVKPIYQNNSDRTLMLNPHRKKMAIVQQKGTSIISKEDIDYLKADNNYCEIHLSGGKVILCSKTLKHMSQRLNHPNFIKVHQSHIINIEKVKHIISTFSELLMESGAKIPISRSCKSGLKEMMKVRFD